MAKKEQQNQTETTREETANTPPEAEVRETPEANEAPEAPGTAETPETNPFEEKYNAEHDSFLRLAAEFDNFRKRTVKEKEALQRPNGSNIGYNRQNQSLVNNMC